MAYIGAIAKRAQVSIKTIRYYETLGLLPKPQRSSSGYRLYDTATIERLQFIQKAQHLGLRLPAIRETLELADRGRCPCGHVARRLRERLRELQQRLAELTALERRLRQALRRQCPPSFQPRGSARCPTIDRATLNRERR